ncbi:MAG: hypothetical protein JSS81_01710 [Acidobacteria bacterium]|nr:hypothetical protein [Acidobacteriota bacterium]
MNVFTNSMFPVSNGRTLNGHAGQFIEEGRKAGALAEKERDYGDIALAESRRRAESDSALAEIARWHYTQAVRLYGEALGAFELAGRIELPEKYRKYVELRIKRCRDEMAGAGARIEELDANAERLSPPTEAG